MRNYSVIIKSVAPLIVILVLGFFTAQLTLSKLSSQSVSLTKLQKDNNTLFQKVKILSSISPDVSGEANVAVIALPESNSSLAVVSQLKSKAFADGLLMGSLKSGSEVKDLSGMSRVDIVFEINGPKSNIIEYLNSLQKIAPITIVDKVKLTQVNEVTRANVTVKAFWTALPKTLPKITDSLVDLSEKEIQTLNQISELTKPQFSDTTATGVGGGRIDPFTQ